MSHRTQDLPPLTGLAHVVRELRYHEAARQILAVVLIVVYTITARPIPLLAAIGLPIAFVGAIVRLYASGFIVKNQELATNGPYRFVRHPLYTGNILLVIGFAIAGSLWWGLPLAALFFWFYYPTAIEYEDRKLHRIFGAAWQQWASRTPALVPTFGAPGGTAGGAGSWSLATSASRNGELYLVIFSLLCLAWVAWLAYFDR
jgi:protein-S-isoprenylcysteine O-methyltransferase Ste14